ncbi:glycosyltransferase [Synechococcales cyanobacterium C]|uniref:Glycosyltransferase n=1 Tax=Petrachloros mirabilis ULC683 TaxID=2781853 RepID=A0A8K1ZYJ5_9CYAN|nr:glycosyltransferase family 2 protein [Petrachloros mirabilis]NCJ06466.1 glycosyltransferase [Petrachloros mirabilis ULC683]
MPSFLTWGLLLTTVLAGVAWGAIARFHQTLQASLDAAPQLSPLGTPPPDLPTLSVIIPAYNEAENLQACVEAVLASELPNPQSLQVWIADDESTDATGYIAQTLAAKDSRVRALSVPPRPPDQLWRGKNWACTQAAAQATGTYLLFIDADVRLQPGAIAAALCEAETQQTDLLSCVPAVECGCLAEWLVQPLIFMLIAASFNFAAVNDPTQATAFAAGPFMLFRRDTYETLGGHRAVAANLVEDVGLARRVKHKGFKLRFILGLEVIQVRMYRSFAALWEGWTKNLYEGSERNLWSTLWVASIMVMVFTLPWGCALLSGLLGGAMVLNPEAYSPAQGILLLLNVIVVGGAIASQYQLRHLAAHRLGPPLRYSGLTGLGGLLMAAIAIASIIKTETGWGWTWRGRSLKA